MALKQPADDGSYSIDPAEPLKNIIVCCTSIAPDQRTEIAQKVEELGGVHKYDLTPNVTHLIVGDYDTPKYRHVARERPDIKAMDAAWIEAMAEIWKNDEELDFFALERQHELKALEKCGTETAPPHNGAPTGRQALLICLTGFGEQRDEIASRIVENGGKYTGDLTRRCTHLIVSKPEGKKFTAAKSWNVYTVTLDWLDQSIERGMILEEAKFDPLLPVGEQGVGTWIKQDDPRRECLGKRSRAAAASNGTEERGARKLRKTASMKLNSQRNNLWGDILGQTDSRDYSFVAGYSNGDQVPLDQGGTPEPTIQQPHHLQPQLGTTQNEGVFARCIFAIDGFNDKRHTVLEDTITTLGGSVASSLREVAASPRAAEHSHRLLVVPQISQPDTHPKMRYDNVEIVTEFYIENCMHNKQFFHPSEHVLGRPFPLFPIPGFSDLLVCSAAFTGLELNQIARSISQLGARFEEEFRRTSSVVVCRSLSAMRKEKLKYALEWGVPVVSADWLWECISTGFKVPPDKYIFRELRNRYHSQPSVAMNERQLPSQPTNTKPNGAHSASTVTRPKIVGGFDASGFDDSPEKPIATTRQAAVARGVMGRHELTTSADFFTAKSQPGTANAKGSDAPLAEVSEARLNKSPSPPKHVTLLSRTKSDPFPGDVIERPSAPSSRGLSGPPSDPPKAGASNTNHHSDKDEEQIKAARQPTKTSERQALSSKLSDLIKSATPLSNDGNNSHTQAPPPRPRRRQILGRAVSNASNGSSAASIHGDGSGSGPRQMTESLRAAVAAGTDEDDLDKDETQPPATQLQYADPDAKQMKEAIMNKMMGGGGDCSSSSKDARGSTTKTVEPGIGLRSLRKR
ncbi:protein kinase activating protein dpb11 [Conoideocrella luteorostrata]|uniref:Protein kinase activating protein dpb11 n=1 Tax=Conoideocrella luteorostrata TaxID=1105319 RepID=A0AAJ0G235_9HYPO|nr:protein kinase activating protein dpb11 [Conoideocrella luteorostrata]